MAPQKLTEYERRRLENIKRNDEVLAALKVRSKLDELSASTKRPRARTKSYKVSPEKKSKTEIPVVIRRSLRTRGMAPDPSTAAGLKDDFDETLSKKSANVPKELPRKLGPISMKDAYTHTDTDKKFIDTVMTFSKNSRRSEKNGSVKGRDEGSFDMEVGISGSQSSGYSEVKCKVKASIDLESMRLEEENIARVLPGRIMNLRFFPTMDMRMVVVGNKLGNVGFWQVDAQQEDGDGIYVYHPHSGPVSGIAIHPFSMSKMFTSGYDGFIRLLDVEKEVFDLVHSSDSAIFSISQCPHDVKSLYFSEGHGELKIWDERTGKSSSVWTLHENRINTIDFNSENFNLMATSSTDGTACVWDLRYVDADKPKSLRTVNHKRAVHSACFSPSGKYLATTSLDDKVGLLSGVNYEDLSMIYHYNQTGRWLSTFRAIWGWDDSYIFIGNMRRGVDVISTSGRTVVTLQSELMSAIPCRFDAHPYKVGMLAGATAGGQVYIWT